jgi:hypothetical protein
VPRLPTVMGLVLCERLDGDPLLGQMSLVGVFHTLRFRNFPTSPHPFTVYAALYGGVGEGTMERMITSLETEQDIHLYRRWHALPGRGQIGNLEIRLQRCVFPAPGRYALKLSFDGREATVRYLDVLRLEESS